MVELRAGGGVCWKRIGESKREVVCDFVDGRLVEGGERCMDLVVEGRVEVGNDEEVKLQKKQCQGLRRTFLRHLLCDQSLFLSLPLASLVDANAEGSDDPRFGEKCKRNRC